MNRVRHSLSPSRRRGAGGNPAILFKMPLLKIGNTGDNCIAVRMF